MARKSRGSRLPFSFDCENFTLMSTGVGRVGESFAIETKRWRGVSNRRYHGVVIRHTYETTLLIVESLELGLVSCKQNHAMRRDPAGSHVLLKWH